MHKKPFICFFLALRSDAGWCVAIILCLTMGHALAGNTACLRPPQGKANGSCEALGDFPVGRGHMGDAWVGCELASRTPGYGMAVFLSEEARPYWDQEIEMYMASLEGALSEPEYRKLSAEHLSWRNTRSRQEDAARRLIESGGTLGAVQWEEKTAEVARQQALHLGCLLERANARKLSGAP